MNSVLLTGPHSSMMLILLTSTIYKYGRSSALKMPFLPQAQDGMGWEKITYSISNDDELLGPNI